MQTDRGEKQSPEAYKNLKFLRPLKEKGEQSDEKPKNCSSAKAMSRLLPAAKNAANVCVKKTQKPEQQSGCRTHEIS